MAQRRRPSPNRAIPADARDLQLLRTQQNAVFDALARAGLDPREFEWSRDLVVDDWGKGDYISVLTHTPTGHYFVFETRGDFHAEFSPGRTGVIDHVGHIRSWDHMLNCVEGWAERLHEEVGAPDLWAAAVGASPLGAPMDEDPDRPFTKEEQAEAHHLVSAARKHLLGEDEFRKFADEINARFDRLEAAITRSSRWTWFHTAIGVTVSIGTWLHSPDVVRDLFRLFHGGFRKLFRLTG